MPNISHFPPQKKKHFFAKLELQRLVSTKNPSSQPVSWSRFYFYKSRFTTPSIFLQMFRNILIANPCTSPGSWDVWQTNDNISLYLTMIFVHFWQTIGNKSLWVAASWIAGWWIAGSQDLPSKDGERTNTHCRISSSLVKVAQKNRRKTRARARARARVCILYFFLTNWNPHVKAGENAKY